MTKLLTLHDQDVFPESEIRWKEPDEYATRMAVKIILFDDENRLALVGTRYRLLPGGGVEEGESFSEAAVREAMEEVGCRIIVEREIGVTEEFRGKIARRQEAHYLLARVVGKKGKPTTLQEDEQGMEAEWYTLPDAISLLQKEKQEISFLSYHSCFNVRTHLVVLLAFQKENGQAVG
ncbi:MAG TPA: NUDIX hydrolase [Candidatus Paceibacterota bacterium]|nr:NUDIX hydrolase [Candidatus Paceibacterota bacterium]